MDDFSVVDVAGHVTYCGSISRTLRRNWPRLIIVYFTLLFLCWNELRFQTSSVDVEAQAQIVGRGHDRKTLVRYSFSDPKTGQHRTNTVEILNPELPTSGKVIAQVISGDTVSSRLKMQSRPWKIHFVIWMHVVFATATAFAVGYLAWEAKTRPLTRQQRAVASWRKRKRLEEKKRARRGSRIQKSLRQ